MWDSAYTYKNILLSNYLPDGNIPHYVKKFPKSKFLSLYLADERLANRFSRIGH